ncbi:hypothetical protein HU200_059262 [Digitaria exilis]|uniref:Uncharacterized protein n=1 Tax=Digitaria exilis TaxID=1010633 RepID=A0A835DYT0_9POAL|nr:hypothetical protein HU200_059262 [Digitaria exilis]
MAGVPPPPRQLEVRRFAAARAGELRSLHAAISSRLDDGSGRSRQQPRSARRRTTGHLPSKRRRRGSGEDAAGAGEAGSSGEGISAARKNSRRVRRRRELAGNPAEGFSVAGDGARRLRTHLWHAKRFAMERQWGFVLPVGAQGRGKGSRSVLKRLKNGTIVHDASYFIPIELDGPEESLLAILRMVLRPSPADKTPDLSHLQDQVMRGVCYENAMLWGVGSPHPQIVGPVTYMWRPLSRENDKSEAGDLSTAHSFDEKCRSSLRRQLWIWIHPAALDEGLSAIRFACERQIQDSGAVVRCCSLEGKIARLEVMGCKAMQSLKKMLHPIKASKFNMVPDTSHDSTSTDTPPDSSTAPHLLEASIIDHAEILHPGAILSMVVHDPREISVQGTVSSSKLVSLDKKNEDLEEDVVPNADEAPSEVGNMLSSMWIRPGKHDIILSDCTELWDSSQSINPPVAEEVLCMEKQRERIKFFCLDSGNDQVQTMQEKDRFSRFCPVVLLKHAKKGMPSLGWSIILPLSWVKPFWLFLVSHGAHVIGLRERRWIATKFRMPCFPFDYPDSKAYASYMSKEAAVLNKAVECRPVAKRPPTVPLPPLWHCIMGSVLKDDGILGDLEVDDSVQPNIVLPKNLSVTKSGDAELSQANVASLQLNVPRTIQMLRQYVKEFDTKYLNLPSDMETEADKPNLTSNVTINMTSSLCLTRVLIRAFKEGSFEDGAVVCAPSPSDLPAWKIRWNRSEEECVEKWELQLPQSYVSSYFSWFDPSTSNLQLPKDDAARDAFRWPIGFVTTGFVHGSNGQDAVAVAFCEAKLLAILRRQQWVHENLHGREICVLVRNPRSAAYRRAVVTIVLEHQESDLEFL